MNYGRMLEADSDPVGGSFFALPQLWIKFGIALRLTREEILRARLHPVLGLLQESLLAEVRFAREIPVRDFVDAVLEPVFHQLWGEALEGSLRLPHEALDYFWAVASDRWGEEAGRSLLLQWAGSRQAQVALWDRYRAEVAEDRDWQRFTLLETILASR